MAVYQKQIAEKLGVSITLVSRVLSGKAKEIGIAPETITRVLQTAEEMGYVPNAAALALKGKATRTIGVVVYDFKDPFFGSIIEQLQIQARSHDYSLVLAGFLNRTPSEQDLQPLYKHSIDGLILVGSGLKPEWLNKFKNIPVARIGHGEENEPSVRVAVDENQSAQLLIDHMVQAGRKNLMYIYADSPTHQLRCEAMIHAAASKGIKLTTCQATENKSYEAGVSVVKELDPSATDALICANDQVAMGALNALNARGIDVPNTISVTGFDDIDAATQFIPSITTIQQPIDEMVATAVHDVVKKSPPSQIDFAAKLITRQSA
jgi:LacI family transcriptional regulator